MSLCWLLHDVSLVRMKVKTTAYLPGWMASPPCCKGIALDKCCWGVALEQCSISLMHFSYISSHRVSGYQGSFVYPMGISLSLSLVPGIVRLSFIGRQLSRYTSHAQQKVSSQVQVPILYYNGIFILDNPLKKYWWLRNKHLSHYISEVIQGVTGLAIAQCLP